MKKKLEADLISIAHRILKLKNKEEVRELHYETRKLYEKLSVLLFLEENFNENKPTIGLHDILVKLEEGYNVSETEKLAKRTVEKELQSEGTTVAQENKQVTPEIEEIKPIIESPINEKADENSITNEELIPVTTIEEERKKETPIIEIPSPDKKQTSFDDILSSIQPEPIFDRLTENKKVAVVPDDISQIIASKIEEQPKDETIITTEFTPDFSAITFEKAEAKLTSNLNDKISKSSGLTLNDRVAFEKNLFDGSAVDLNRVISQIATFDNFSDAKNFIDQMVKPDYNEWRGKDEFAERFMEFVESKFV